jgi:L-threonylcarbamoyladenylate synthase
VLGKGGCLQLSARRRVSPKGEANFLFEMLRRVDALRPDPATIASAADILRGGGLVAFPTETVYGLGANALDAAAVERIYQAKGRPAYNPLIVHVADASRVTDVARDWPEKAARLANAFWPGPLTLVVAKRPEVPAGVTAGLDTVAVRVPLHPVAHALLLAAGIPVAAPSANRSTEVSPTTGAHVDKSLGSAVDLILDAGPTAVGIESTVVDVSVDPPVVLRPGMIASDALSRVVGEIGEPPRAAGESARRSPGMLDRHYAPRAALVLADAGRTRELIEDARHGGRKTGVILFSRGSISADRREALELPDDPAGYAAGLYAALHTLDDAGVDVIVVEQPPERPEWHAIRDRLLRASRENH